MNAGTEEFMRAYGGLERVEWVKRQRSVTGALGPCVNAHVISGGTSRKADAEYIVPLTWAEHEWLHKHGRDAFNVRHGLDLLDEAAETERRWQAYQTTNPQLPW